MPEFQFNDSHRRSLKVCNLSDGIIQEIEQLLNLEVSFIEHFRKVKFKIPKGQISKIRGHIAKLQESLNEFDVDNVHLLPGKDGLLERLESVDELLVKMQKRKRGNTQTQFDNEVDDLAPKIAKILIKNGIKVDRRGQTFKGVLDVVFKAIDVDRTSRTAIKNKWKPEIELRAAYAEKGLDYDSLAEKFEECD
jgi:hypothetical protein